MKHPRISTTVPEHASARRLSRLCQTLLLGAVAAVWQPAACPAQTVAAATPDGQILTRGPVHEAFAGIITFNAEPGVVIPKAPPADLTEIPPAERPAGDNITWIPGYWAWDDERTDFLWVSGTWRALPPGREWIAGYWGDAAPGYQWTSGYWADVTVRETTYLPEPPASVEAGPNTEAPADDYRWIPGTWAWSAGAYAWGPGYWSQGRADWDWIPAHYVWTRRGYIHVGGYWDHSLNHRGLVYAPVYYGAAEYGRTGYSYTPSVVISLGVFLDHLFLRPSYRHYYFGDYYAPAYQQGGYYSAYSTNARRYTYDPVYTHQLWEHRQDRDWQARGISSFEYRRDHEQARPPRTWAAQQAIPAGNADFTRNRMRMGTTVGDMKGDRSQGLDFQAVPTDERARLNQRGREVNRFNSQRQLAERAPAESTRPAAGRLREPTKVVRDPSPIASLPVDKIAPARRPPAVQRLPQTDRRGQSQPGEANRQPKPTQPRVQPEPRKPNTQPVQPRVQPEPRKPNTQPVQPRVQPESRKPNTQPAQPRVQPEPRKPNTQPAPPRVQPEPRKQRETEGEKSDSKHKRP